MAEEKKKQDKSEEEKMLQDKQKERIAVFKSLFGDKVNITVSNAYSTAGITGFDVQVAKKSKPKLQEATAKGIFYNIYKDLYYIIKY